MVLYVTDIIQRIRTKQAKIFGSRRTKISSSYSDDIPMNDFVIEMDNYFTLPKLIRKLRDIGLGVVGTARFRKGWPPKKLREINK